MVKRIFSFILVSIFLICSVVTNAYADTNTAVTVSSQIKPVTVKVEDKFISLDVQPYIEKDAKIMLPLVTISKAFGNRMHVEINDGQVRVINNRNVIKFEGGSEKVTVDNESTILNEKPVIKEGDVFVPLQFFSEALGKLVDFDDSTNIVKIYSPRNNSELFFDTYLASEKDKTIASNLDNYLTELQKPDTNNFHGIVLVAKDGKILLNKGYGMSDFDQGIKNTSQTRFPIGSMTKQFTAMAVMQLVEKGLINEQDKLSKYIPDFPNGNDITIYNLLTHTSGLAIYNQLPEFLEMKPKDAENPQNIINLIKNKPLNFKPGTKFEYCNTGYFLLGYIVEKVSGMSYEDYLEKNIFKPLNMNDTGAGYNGNEKMYNAKGYIGYLDIMPISDELTLRGIHGAGELYSTVEDLYRWDKALDTEKLVSKKTMDKIFSKSVKMSENGKAYYGYGWMIYDGEYGHEEYHAGNVMGFSSNIERYTDKDLTIIILTNLRAYDCDSLNSTLADICFEKKYEMPKEKKTIKADSKDLEKCAGNYTIEGIGTISITTENGHIYYDQNNTGKLEIFPEAKNKFFFRITDAEIVFNTDSYGVVRNFDYYQWGAKYHGEKTK